MKNSLEQYINCQAELYGRQTLVADEGFVVYKMFDDGSLYLHLIYVEPQFRHMGLGSVLTKKVLDFTMANTAYSYVDTTTLDPEASLMAHLKYGFKIHSVNDSSINLVFKKQPKAEE